MSSLSYNQDEYNRARFDALVTVLSILPTTTPESILTEAIDLQTSINLKDQA